jgi:hypothetical protein
VANSVHQDIHGPIWPLGNIPVPTPGTYVNIMNNVDPTLVDSPESPTSATSDEYTVRCQQIIFEAGKAGAAPPKIAANTGNVYIVRKPIAGAGGVSDTGTVVKTIAPGQTFILGSAALNRNVFSPYEFFVDADTAGDGVTVTLVIQ